MFPEMKGNIEQYCQIYWKEHLSNQIRTESFEMSQLVFICDEVGPVIRVQVNNTGSNTVV